MSVVDPAGTEGSGLRFTAQQLYLAAQLYYVQDATQAQIAETLGTSRATVSRILAEARRTGIVRIEVIPPRSHRDLADALAGKLGLDAVYLVPTIPAGAPAGLALAPGVVQALLDLQLRPGEVLLVSSGTTVWGVVQADLPRLPGIVLAPMVGGQDEVHPWFQTNELARQTAERVGGRARLLHAPAMPSPELHAMLLADEATRSVLRLWDQARTAILGIGPALPDRSLLPTFLAGGVAELGRAVGDISSRFFDELGTPIGYPGESQLIGVSWDQLRRIPAGIVVGVGAHKLRALLAAARARLYRLLVTDEWTANALLSTLERTGSEGRPPATPPG